MAMIKETQVEASAFTNPKQGSTLTCNRGEPEQAPPLPDCAMVFLYVCIYVCIYVCMWSFRITF